MFGLSTELIAKGKLATTKRFECELSNHLTVANFPLVFNSVDKQNICYNSSCHAKLGHFEFD